LWDHHHSAATGVIMAIGSGFPGYNHMIVGETNGTGMKSKGVNE